MLRSVLRMVAVVVLVVVSVAVAFLLAMRAEVPRVQDSVRRLNRAFFNPRQMRTAGTPGAYAAVIRHVGRRSGATYETPVGAEPTDAGFVVALPYGARPDWVQNVMAAGSATLVHDGGTHAVDRPELVPMDDVAHHFTPADQRAHRLFGIDRALRVHRVDAVAG